MPPPGVTRPGVKLHGAHFDVAIVGAGINGASTAQLLAAAGYQVLLVDQADFANGATARSSRLLHCGLRHLASGKGLSASLRPDRLLRALSVARHDMLARDELVATIPARLRRIRFCLPIYADDAYAPWQLDAAFALLRLLSPRGEPLDYRRYAPGQLKEIPFAAWLRDPEKLKGVAVFREYLFDWPERIALDALFDARRLGAEVRNYTRVERLRRDDGDGRWRLSLQGVDPGTGAARTVNLERAEVSADLVLNLAGAWVDELAARTGVAVAPRCAGIRGVHIALRLPAEFSGWGVFAFNRIREPMYCLPMNDFHYVGLTRRQHTDAPGEVAASDDEIDWLLAEFNHCLPKLGITRADILFSWAGINPLTRDPDEPLGSREICLHDYADDGLTNLLALTGAPIVTHRRVARHIVAEVAKRIPSSAPARRPKFHRLEEDPAATSDAIESDAFSIARDAAVRCARDESPANLEDLLQRRLGAGWASDQGLALARPVAEAVAAELGWSGSRIEAEVTSYARRLHTMRRRPGA